MDVYKELKFLRKLEKNGGSGVGVSGWGCSGLVGVRVDVYEELKFLCKFKKNGGLGRRDVGLGVRVDVYKEFKFF